MEKKALRMFVILKVLEAGCLGFIATTYVPFLLDKGLSLFQANQVNIAFMFVNTLLDPFTGSLADKIGQKKTYIIGFIFVGLGSFIYGVGSGFWSFVLGESVAAIGVALWSEALESWIRGLYGKEVGHKAITKGGYFSKIFAVAFGFAGAFAAARFGLHIPWFMGCVVAVLAIVVGVVLTKDLPDSTNHHDANKGSVKESLKLVLRVPELRFTVIVTCVVAMSFQAFNMFWSPMFKGLSGSVEVLGFVWAGISVFSSLGNYLIRNTHDPSKKTVGVLILLTGIPIFVSALLFGNNFWGLLIGFLLHEIGRTGIFPLLFTYSNDFIPDEIRSTCNSVRGSFRTIGAVIGLFVSGLLTEYISPVNVWMISGTILILLSAWIMFSKEKGLST